MSEIIIYTKPGCPYCARAKQLLKAKAQDYTEIDISSSPNKRSEMVGRAKGRATVPQIFIDGQHIGGCDDIHDLERSGKLDGLLDGATQHI